ncbi:hypothetical protein B0H17DRAFT_1341530 [Mycena rosella]|uniref:RRM domain-containing protein n=1 Tax=Mycena rosella TaxID=1033263 RepID=A0AAD7B4V6_MYCRO|nr:hypothetical protein B0H17DRAFT_1341530 [Mycena rosella]
MAKHGPPPFTRRAIALTNLPPDAHVVELLALVHTGALEHVKLSPGAPSAELFFLAAHSAARSPARGSRTARCTYPYDEVRAHARIRADPAMVHVHVAYWPDPCELPAGAGVAPRADTNVTDLAARVFGGAFYALDTISFFRAEDARDFYFPATRGPLRIHDHDIAVIPYPDTPPGPLPRDCTRVVAVRAFNPPLLVLTRAKLRADFGRFGEIERVWYHRTKRLNAYVAFARADDALYALEHAAVACPEYAQCTLRFAPDPCARRAPVRAPLPAPALCVRYGREDAHGKAEEYAHGNADENANANEDAEERDERDEREDEEEQEEEARTLMAAEQARDRPLGVRSMRIAGLLGIHMHAGAESALKVDADTHADTGTQADTGQAEEGQAHWALGLVRRDGKARYAPEEVERMRRAVEWQVRRGMRVGRGMGLAKGGVLGAGGLPTHTKREVGGGEVEIGVEREAEGGEGRDGGGGRGRGGTGAGGGGGNGGGWVGGGGRGGRAGCLELGRWGRFFSFRSTTRSSPVPRRTPRPSTHAVVVSAAFPRRRRQACMTVHGRSAADSVDAARGLVTMHGNMSAQSDVLRSVRHNVSNTPPSCLKMGWRVAVLTDVAWCNRVLRLVVVSGPRSRMACAARHRSERGPTFALLRSYDPAARDTCRQTSPSLNALRARTAASLFHHHLSDGRIRTSSAYVFREVPVRDQGQRPSGRQTA